MNNILSIIHILFILFELTYPYIIDKKYGYDIYYILFIYLILLHWVYFDNKCIITYLHDKYNEKDEFEYIFSKYINKQLFTIIFIIVITVNIIIVEKRNNFKSMRNIIYFTIPIVLFYLYFINSKIFKNNKVVITEIYKFIIISLIIFIICKNKLIYVF